MSASAEAALGVTGIAVVAHTHMLDAVKAFVIAKKTDAPAGAAVSGVTSFKTAGDFAKWAAAFTGLAFVVMVGGESEQYGGIVTALAWLIAATSLFTFYPDILALFGQGQKS